MERSSRGKAAGRLSRKGAAALLAASLGGAATIATGIESSYGASFAGQSLTVLLTAPTTPKAKQFYAHVASLFKKDTGATLNYDEFSSTAQEQATVETAAAAHTGPDVFQLGFSIMPLAYSSKAFVTLTKSDWAQLGGESAFLSSELTESGPNAKHYIGVPLFVTPRVLVYNTALFKRAKIAAPPTTWSQFVTDAKKITALGKGIYGTAMDPSDPSDPWKLIWEMNLQAGNKVLSGGTDVRINSRGDVNTMQFYFDWITKFHIAPPQSLTWQDSQLIAAFSSGTIGMLPLISDEDPVLQGTPVAGKFSYAPMPSVPYGMSSRPKGGQAAESPVSGNLDAIASYANKPLALAYLKLMTSRQVQLEQYDAIGWLPCNISALDQLKTSQPETKVFTTSAEHAFGLPFAVGTGDIEVALDAALPKIASTIATSGSVSRGTIASVLSAENAAAQAEVDGS